VQERSCRVARLGIGITGTLFLIQRQHPSECPGSRRRIDTPCSLAALIEKVPPTKNDKMILGQGNELHRIGGLHPKQYIMLKMSRWVASAMGFRFPGYAVGDAGG
jgi:hypothetical protein